MSGGGGGEDALLKGIAVLCCDIGKPTIAVDALSRVIEYFFTMFSDSDATLLAANGRLFGAAGGSAPTEILAKLYPLLAYYKLQLSLASTRAALGDAKTLSLSKKLSLVKQHVTLGAQQHILLVKQIRLRTDGGAEVDLPGIVDDDKADKLKPAQKLILHILHAMHLKSLLKDLEGNLYEPFYTADGHFTYHYRPYSSIKEFLYAEVHRDNDTFDWLTATRSCEHEVVNYITHCCEPTLPVIQFNRHIFSFRNGVFDAEDNRFHPYVVLEIPAENRPVVDSLCPAIPKPPKLESIYTQTQRDVRGVLHCGIFCSAGVADKYFHWDFDEDPYDDPMDIPIKLDKILVDQKFDTEVQRWLYASLGRVVFAVGDRDRDTYCVYIRGIAGSGKSLILQQIRHLWSAQHVGMRQATARATFDKEHLLGKYVVLCPETDNKLTMTLTDFNSMVAGEEIAADIRYAKSVVAPWSAQLIFAGNNGLPAHWKGSGIERRILMWRFNEYIVNSDSGLSDQLQFDAHNFLKKIIGCYFQIRARQQNKGLWTENTLPKYFWDQRNILTQENNSIAAFVLDTEKMELGDQKSITMASFKSAYIAYCEENKLPTVDLIPDNYGSVFYMNSLKKYSPGIKRLQSDGLVAATPPDHRFAEIAGGTRDFIVGIGLRPRS